MKLEAVCTVKGVFDALGGARKVRELTGRTGDRRVTANWKAKNRLPRDTYLILSGELEKVGKIAPASLFGMTEPSAEQAA